MACGDRTCTPPSFTFHALRQDAELTHESLRVNPHGPQATAATGLRRSAGAWARHQGGGRHRIIVIIASPRRPGAPQAVRERGTCTRTLGDPIEEEEEEDDASARGGECAARGSRSDRSPWGVLEYAPTPSPPPLHPKQRTQHLVVILLLAAAAPAAAPAPEP